MRNQHLYLTYRSNLFMRNYIYLIILFIFTVHNLYADDLKFYISNINNKPNNYQNLEQVIIQDSNQKTIAGLLLCNNFIIKYQTVKDSNNLVYNFISHNIENKTFSNQKLNIISFKNKEKHCTNNTVNNQDKLLINLIQEVSYYSIQGRSIIFKNNQLQTLFIIKKKN